MAYKTIYFKRMQYRKYGVLMELSKLEGWNLSPKFAEFVDKLFEEYKQSSPNFNTAVALEKEKERKKLEMEDDKDQGY